MVKQSQKIGDIDPRGIREYCFRISDKANAVAGGVLEAIYVLRRRMNPGV
jgi:xanthine dehydrogenase accessory factor